LRAPPNFIVAPPGVSRAQNGLSLGSGKNRPFRFGPIFLCFFKILPLNLAKTPTRDPNDIDGNMDRARSGRVARDARVNERICGVGSLLVALRKVAMV